MSRASDANDTRIRLQQVEDARQSVMVEARRGVSSGGSAYDQSGAAASGDAAHVAAVDPHPQYLTAAEGAAADSAVQSSASADATTKANEAKARNTHSGTQSADTLTDGTTNKAYLATERTKLTGVATGATANSTDASLRTRSTHTGTQAVSTITGLGTAATTAASAYATAAQGVLADAAGVDSGWIVPTLLNSWGNLGAPFATAAYRKVGKTVYIRGLLAGGTFVTGTQLFVLPSGYYPTSHRLFHTVTDNGHARIDVRNDGIVQLNTPTGTNAYLSVDGLIFQVD